MNRQRKRTCSISGVALAFLSGSLLFGCGGDDAGDGTPPGFASITAAPDPARSGDTLTITFTASETLAADPTVTVDGNAASFVSEAALLYTYSYTVLGTEGEGAAAIAVSADDPAGNSGADSGNVTLDFTAPGFASIAATPDPAKSGDALTIIFTASETLAADPAVTVDGNAASFVSEAALLYTYSYTALGTEGEGAAAIAVSADDPAGNPGADSGSVVFDFTAPGFASISAAPDPGKTSDALTITFTASETLAAAPTVTVDGNAASFVSEVSLLYTYTYTVLGTEGDGAAAIAVSADDPAGNPGADAGSVTLDVTAPTFAGIAASPDPARSGDTLTVTFTASETLAANPAVTVDGNAAGFVSNATLFYTYDYVAQGTEAEGAVTVAVSGSDVIGNPGADNGSVTFDFTAPVFSSISSMFDPAKAADMLLITFTASEILAANPTVTVDGNAAGFVSVFGLDYAYSYTVQGTETEGAAAIAVSGDDVLGNGGADSGSVTLDFTAPGFASIAATPDPAKSGDALTITFTASETLAAAPTVTVDGIAASFVSEAALLYTYSYTVLGTEGEGAAAIAVSADDPAGNPGADAGSVTLDFTAPGFASIAATPDPAKSGDALTITFTASETLAAAPTVTVDGNAASFVSEAALLYTYSYTVLGTEWEGAAAIAVSADDPAGNPGADAGSVTFDFTTPGAIGTLAASYTGALNTIALGWTATGDDAAVGTATSYVLKRSTSPITAGNFDAATTVSQGWTPPPAGSSESHNVSLTWYTVTYYFAMKAEDEVGNTGPISNVITVNTNAQGAFPGVSYGYGDVAYNSFVDRNFVVTNTSPYVDLNISNVQLTGDAVFSITAGDPGDTLAPGVSHTVTVRFLPVAETGYSATLSFDHNASNESTPYSIALTGAGVNVAPSAAGTDPAPAFATDPATLIVNVTDDNSDLPGPNDIVSVTVDLTEAGGSAAQAMAYTSNVGAKTGVYTYDLDTTTFLTGAYRLPVTATDAAGETATTTLDLLVYTGAQRVVSLPSTTIQDAIDASFDGDMVVVPGGTYRGFGNKGLHTDGKRIIVASVNGAAATIIDCEDVGMGFAMSDTAETNATVIAGFTILDGSASGFVCLAGASFAPSPTVMDCVFMNNTNSSAGGAMVINGASVTPRIVGCTFLGNTAGGGGAVYVVTSASPTFEDCLFEGNVALAGGGAASLESWTSTSFSRCTFDLNSGNTTGGAISTFLADSVFTGCTFTDNTCGQYGGAVFLGASTTQLTGCYLTDNRGNWGGGAVMGFQGGSLTIASCTFARNQAPIGPGGAIGSNMGSSASTLTTLVSDCIFEGNTAVNGGGLEIGGIVSTVVRDCLFAGNTATTSGGGIYFAPVSGNASILNCTVVGNDAAVGGGIYFGSNPSAMIDSIVWGNTDTGPDADQVFVTNSGGTDVSISNSNIGTAAGAINDVGSRINFPAGFSAGPLGNLSADPLFVTGPGGDYYLSQTASGQGADSPCVDAGSDTAANLGLDTRTTRTNGTTDVGDVDMGYHYEP
jgi:hypothetical protein